MSRLDRELLSEKTAVIERHLARVDRVYRAAREGPADLRAFLAALAERIQ
jgi:hypothetical protein